MIAITALYNFPFTKITIHCKTLLFSSIIIEKGTTYYPNIFSYSSLTIKIKGLKTFSNGKIYKESE